MKQDYSEDRTLLFYVQEQFADLHEHKKQPSRTIIYFTYIADYVIDIDSGDILKCRDEKELSRAHLNVQAVYRL